MKKEHKFWPNYTDVWINTFILAKNRQLIDKIYCVVAGAIVLIGTANVFGKFLSIIHSIVILIIYLGFSGFIEYRLFILPFLRDKDTDNKLLLSTRRRDLILTYVVFGLIICIALYFLNDWAVLIVPLYAIMNFSIWVKDIKTIKKNADIAYLYTAKI